MQGEGAQTPSAGSLKYRQLQDVFVQMHGNVSSQFIWEIMQQLRERMGKIKTLMTTAIHPIVQSATVLQQIKNTPVLLMNINTFIAMSTT